MHQSVHHHITLIQEECRAESKRTAVTVLQSHYPHLSARFLGRHLPTILGMSPAEWVYFLGHPDPTGERAVNNVLAAAGESL